MSSPRIASAGTDKPATRLYRPPGEPRKRRLLVVSYHFPPGEGVGALRWAGLTKHLARRDWKVRVVTRFGPGARLHAPSVEVFGRPPQVTLNDRYVRWKRNRGRGAAQENGSRGDGGIAESERTNLPRTFLRELGGLLSWPDEGRGWMIPAIRATRAAIQEFSPDVIVSSGPPHSTHIAVRIARGRRDIPWFMDLRDPWEHQVAETRVVKTSFAWMEAGMMRSATGVVVTTPELRDALLADYPGLDVHWIPNGVDLDLFPEPSGEPLPGFSPVHLGSVYKDRDPGSVLEAFGRFLERCPRAREAGSTFRFVGNVERRHRRTVERASAAGLAGHVELTGLLPRDEALSILQRSSLSVVLAQQQWEMVPAKLYESVALGLPTLVVAEEGSASFQAARRVGALAVDPADVGGIAALYEAAWKGELEAAGEPEVPLEYGELARAMAGVLKSRLRSAR